MRKVEPYGFSIAGSSAIPFTIAPIACSRMPKAMLRPGGGGGESAAPPAPLLLLAGCAHVRVHLVRDVEGQIGVESHRLLRRAHLGLAERGAVRLRRVHRVRGRGA